MECTFHHVHLICSDLDETEHFFIDTLGARFLERTFFGEAEGRKFMLGDTGIFLRVANATEKIDTDSSQPRFGYHHIGVVVDDVDAAHRELKAKGVVFTVPPRHTPRGAMAFFKGPDDISVELFQPAG